MNTRKRQWLIGMVSCLAAASWMALASDWPQWRGLHRDGHSTDTGLLKEWPEGGPPQAWQASGIGEGFSGVSMADGRLFTMGDIGEAQYVLALDPANGNILWKTNVGPPHHHEYGGPRATPTTDGDRIYTTTTEGVVVCLESATGNIVWQKDMPAEFGARMASVNRQGPEYEGYNWKFAESPLVDGDKLVVTPGAKDAVLVALNKRSGAVIWKSSMPEIGDIGSQGAGYSSIVISHGAGVKQYVQMMGRGAIGVEADTGRFLWGYNRVANNVAIIPTPVVQGDDVFVSSGYGTGAALLRLHKDGDGVRAEEVYFLEGRTLQNHHGGIILQDGYIYTGTGHNKGFPICAKMSTGEIAWGPVRNKGRDSAAIAYADGQLYFRYQNGWVVLVDATPEGYKEHGSFTIPNVTHPSWPPPVIDDGKLYLREQDHLYVYDVRAH